MSYKSQKSLVDLNASDAMMIKFIIPTKEFVVQHYDDLNEHPFFNSLCQLFQRWSYTIAMVSVHGLHFLRCEYFN
jgi:hypothetical protein